jgi:hypothetical protein
VIETDPQIVQNGKRCLKHIFKNEYDKGGAGWMHHWWDGSDVAYLRYYFRLSKGGDWSNQKLFQLHGHQRGQRYGTGAGNRPTGYDWFCSGTGVGSKDWKNTGPPWTNIMLYTYFPGQKGGYGDNVMPNKGIQPGIPEGEWVCYEVMIKLNDVGKTNGEQRLWIDGKLVIEQTEMEWRKAENLVINNVMLATYTHTPPEPGKERYFWLDSIVLARDYIGPMSRPAAPAPAPAKAKAGEGAATPPPAALDDKALAEREAGKLLQMARQAEQAGQQDVAKKLYSQIVEKHPGTEAAGKAKVKLE